MKRTKKDYLDLVDETVKHYSEDPTRRALSTGLNTSGDCEYHTEDGKMCAVGRCLINPKVSQKKWGVTSIYYLSQDFRIESSFKKEYRGFDVDFWRDLQRLHDARKNWDEKGITECGLFVAGEIKDTITENNYTKIK